MSIMCHIGKHTWNGCKCAVCNKTRDEKHDWKSNCEECSICRAARQGAHRWSGCKCAVCGKTRDEKHDWARNCEGCSICGSVRQNAHSWSGCRCTACGTTRDEGHDWGKDSKKCSRCGAPKPYASAERYQADLLRAKACSLKAWRKISEAEQALQLAIIADDTCSEAYYDLAHLKGEGRGNSSELIILLLEEAVKKRPDNIVAIRHLCLFLVGQKQYDRVIQLIESTIRLDILAREPFDVLAGLFLRQMVSAYERKGDFDSAANVKRQLSEQLSAKKYDTGIQDSRDGYKKRADLALKAGDNQGAIQILRRGIFENTSMYPLVEVTLWEALSGAYLTCGKDREALACLLLLEDDSPFRAATSNKLMTISGLYRKLGNEMAAEYYSQLFLKSAVHASIF